MTSVELRQDRAKLVHDAGEILKKVGDEKRNMTPEEEERFDKLHADGDLLLKTIERMERQESNERSLAASRLAAKEALVGRESRKMSADPAENAKLEMDAFRSFLRGGWQGMTEEERTVANVGAEKARRIVKDLGVDERAAQTVTTTGGGYLIPREFQAELDQAMLAFGPMLNPAAVRVMTTSSGAPLDWPTVNDTSNKGRLLGINTIVTNTGITYGSVTLSAYKFSSDSVLVPVELAQDSAFPVDAHVRDVLAERIGRIVNDYCTTGSGSSQPMGIVTGATASGITGFDMSDRDNATIQTTWYPQLVALVHSIDPAYRMAGSFMMHDTMLRDLRLMRDTTGNPIWQAGLRAGEPDTILGYPYWINQSMANTGTNANIPILFGNLKKFIVRMVRPTVMLRLVERYADYFQIGYISYERLDSNLLDAGTHPIKTATVVT